MNEDNIKKIFRTRMGSSALQTYRDRALLDNVERTERLVCELNSLFSELEGKYNLLSNEEELHVSAGELEEVLQAKISEESVSEIGRWMALNDDDVLICLENGLATLLEVFLVTIDDVKSKEHIDYYSYSHIEYVVFSMYGLYCNETEEHQSKAFLEKTTDRPLHGFFDTFVFDDKCVCSFIEEIVPLEILKKNRDFAYEDTANRYLEKFHQASDDEVIEHLDSFLTSSGFLPISDMFYLVSRRLLRQGNLGVWMALMMKMEVPILQNELLFALDDYALFEQIADYILQNKLNAPRIKIVFALLRKRWLNCLIENTKNIHETTNIIEANKEENAYIEEAKSEWEGVLEIGINTFVQQNLKVFSPTEFSKWCLKYRLYENNRKTAQSDANNTIIAGLWDCLLQTVSWKNLDTSNGDYRFVLFCVSCYLKEEQTDDNKLRELSKDMETAIERDDFFWSMNLNETSLREMREWLKLISLLNKNYPLELLRRNLTIWEGYATTPLKGIYKQQRRECFVMSTLALLFEKDDYFESEKDKLELFKQIAQFVIKQCHCCVFERDILQYYFQPLLILELVANQILIDAKDWYHSLLLENLDDFRVLLRVLTEENASLTEENRKILATRKEQEWKYIKATMDDLPQTKREIPSYEERMVKLGI